MINDPKLDAWKAFYLLHGNREFSVIHFTRTYPQYNFMKVSFEFGSRYSLPELLRMGYACGYASGGCKFTRKFIDEVIGNV